MLATEPSLWSFITDAGLVVKVVMLILVAASVASWTMIFQRLSFLKQTRLGLRQFEEQFWSGADLQKLYGHLSNKRDRTGLENIFYGGFSEYLRLSQKGGVTPAAIMDGVGRAMRIAQARELEKLESHLSFLATVGSTSPYVGLFGTVWGIMSSFQGLVSVQQASIAMVAPGISEALIATAMGLFAAIPAVIAYNRFSNDVERLINQYETFQEEFFNLLHRQAHGNS